MVFQIEFLREMLFPYWEYNLDYLWISCLVETLEHPWTFFCFLTVDADGFRKLLIFVRHSWHMPLTVCYSLSLISHSTQFLLLTWTHSFRHTSIVYECVEIMPYWRHTEHIMASKSLINNIYHIQLIYKFFSVWKTVRIK